MQYLEQERVDMPRRKQKQIELSSISKRIFSIDNPFRNGH